MPNIGGSIYGKNNIEVCKVDKVVCLPNMVEFTLHEDDKED